MTPDHPDTTTAWQQAKEIRRGGMQAADDRAMEAYWRAIEEGRSKKEAEEEFFKHFNKKPCESKRTSAVS
jgi:hypothetical protein